MTQTQQPTQVQLRELESKLRQRPQPTAVTDLEWQKLVGQVRTGRCSVLLPEP